MTAAPIADCKAALAASNGDLTKAQEFLTARGKAILSKKAGRDTLQGVIACALSPCGQSAAFVELNCETDFAARDPKFQEFSLHLVQAVLRASDPRAAGVHELAAADLAGVRLAGDRPAADVFADVGVKINEGMRMHRARIVHAPGALIGAYVHGAGLGPGGVAAQLAGCEVGRQGAFVVLAGASAGKKPAAAEKMRPAARQLAQHVLGMRPTALAPTPAMSKSEAASTLAMQKFIFDPVAKRTVKRWLREELAAEVTQFGVLEIGDGRAEPGATGPQ